MQDTIDTPSLLHELDNLPSARRKACLDLIAWVTGTARFSKNPDAMLDGFCERLIAAGVPIERVSVIVRVLHSEFGAVARYWETGKPAHSVPFPYTSEPTEAYLRSPFHRAYETGKWVRFNPQTADPDLFGIVPELQEDGYTDYFCIPIFFCNGMSNGVTLATRATDGFTPADLACLHLVIPAFGNLMEIMALYRMQREVLGYYVGEEPQKLILEGAVRRGEVKRIRAAILFVDMRGYTALSLGRRDEEVTHLLNRYYDSVVSAVETAGGEVVKFIGDGVLAMIRAEEGATGAACRAALAAADEIAHNVRVASENKDEQPFSVGVALHFGRVAYGNVGSGTRLDFTTIGRDVNMASRIADLCGTLDRSLLLSKPLTDRLNDIPTRYLGAYPLKGIPGLQQIFEVDRPEP
ncbi:MAG: adenylate/guanylate cyclase domain-containing protein [Hyphomicrobiales bacterium]|nr:adenylate/guanylate cyclase domain-containing protein [Hyphomicrobiales bacterium]